MARLAGSHPIAARSAGQRQEPSRGDLGARGGGHGFGAAKLPSLQRLVAARPAALLIDDVDRVEDETALFHLLNFSRENDAFCY